MTTYYFTQDEITKIERALTNMEVGKVQEIGRFIIAKTDNITTRVFLPSGNQAAWTVREFITANMDLVGNAIEAAKARKGTPNPVILDEQIFINAKTNEFGLLEYTAERR